MWRSFEGWGGEGHLEGWVEWVGCGGVEAGSPGRVWGGGGHLAHLHVLFSCDSPASLISQQIFGIR